MAIKELIKIFIPCFLLDLYHYLLVFFGAVIYGFSGKSRALKIIGVTGTSGKSTVVDFICRILDEAGYKTASISSIRFKINEKEWKNKYKMTMPGRFVIQRFLNQAKKEKCQYVVLEVSSEGIKQRRHKFINFDIAVFTNLSPEHIESHCGFENYRNEKLKLFKATKNTHIINIDDENAEYFLKIPAMEKRVYSFKNPAPAIGAGRGYKLEIDSKLKIKNLKFVKAADIKNLSNRIDFKVNNVQFGLNLLGDFNVYNALAAICVGLSQGISLDVCKKAIEKIKGVQGRMEVVIEKPFKVIVDYAHTPEQLENVYKTLRNKTQEAKYKTQEEGELICVLGSCGGGRDKWKRPVFGKLAAKYCDKIIITDEDPYDEEPMEIIEQVAKWAGKKAEKILDRRRAIRKALLSVKDNDVVVITGKGSEPWMCVKGGKKISWDDRKIACEEFNKIYFDLK